MMGNVVGFGLTNNENRHKLLLLLWLMEIERGKEYFFLVSIICIFSPAQQHHQAPLFQSRLKYARKRLELF